MPNKSYMLRIFIIEGYTTSMGLFQQIFGEVKPALIECNVIYESEAFSMEIVDPRMTQLFDLLLLLVINIKTF